MSRIRSAGKMLIAISVFMIFMLSALTVSAEQGAQFYIPDGAVKEGESFEVTVVFSSDHEIGWVEGNLVYDSSAAQFVSGNGANGGGGILTLKDFALGETTELSFTLEFIALKEGSTEMMVSNTAIFAQDSSLLGSPYAYGIITIAKGSGTTTTTTAPDSVPDDASSQETTETTTATTVTTTTTAPVETGSDGYPTKGVLKSLTVSEGELVPPFSPDIYNYTVKVGNSVEYAEIDGETASITDYIWFEGSNYLQVGDNIRRITVTADTGAEHTYIITFQRAAAEEDPDAQEAFADADIFGESSGSEEYVSSDDPRDLQSRVIIEAEENDPLEQYKRVLIPAMIIVLFVLILAVVIIVVWLKGKALKKSSKNKGRKKSAKGKRKK